MSSVSVVVCTLDEELHIERLIHSVGDLGHVFVVDAGSEDRTRELAEAAGATVVVNPWAGYSAQKNWALDSLPLESEWLLFLDADEFLTPELRREISAAIRRTDVDGFWLPEMNIFMGRPLKHAWWYPAYQLRLFRRGNARYEDRRVHESVLLEGRADFLRETLYHESLKGLDAYVERHLRYASFEAEEMRRQREGGGDGQRRGRLLGSWPERRRYLKLNVWYRMPLRPLVRFVWLYVFKRGFLDGRPGLVYCKLLAMYELLIDAKLAELTPPARSSDHPLSGTVAEEQ